MRPENLSRDSGHSRCGSPRHYFPLRLSDRPDWGSRLVYGSFYETSLLTALIGGSSMSPYLSRWISDPRGGKHLVLTACFSERTADSGIVLDELRILCDRIIYLSSPPALLVCNVPTCAAPLKHVGRRRPAAQPDNKQIEGVQENNLLVCADGGGGVEPLLLALYLASLLVVVCGKVTMAGPRSRVIDTLLCDLMTLRVKRSGRSVLPQGLRPS
jgi:hypothetical protein